MEQKKVIDIDTKFRWKILPDESGTYVGVCDRLKLTIEAATIEELTDMAANAASMLFLDIYEEDGVTAFNQYAFNHSVAYTVSELDNYIDVAPTPIIVE